MTMLDPWDDDRLDAAYAARLAAHPTPADLTATTVEAIRGRAAPRTPSRRVWPLAAAAAIVVVIGGLAVGALALRAPGAGMATPSSPSTTPSLATSTPPTEVAGLAVISVADAIVVRDAGKDGRELAVRGWLTRGNGPVGCHGDTEPISLVLSDCDRMVWFTERPQTMRLSNGQTGFLDGGPDGPTFVPYLDQIDTSWLSPMPPVGGSAPQELVMIGHFDGRMAELCPDDERDACRDLFVVDRVWWVNGRELTISDVNLLDRPRTSTTDDIEGVIETGVPGWPILSSMTVDGSRLSTFEPALTVEDAVLLTGEAAVWIVRMVVDGQPATYLVVDGSLEAYEITAEGRVVPVGGGTSPPADPASAWPPDGAAMVYLPGVEVAVVDASGRLLGARDATLQAAALPRDLESKPVHLAATTTTGHVLLAWSGSACDRSATITIDAHLSAISVERVEAPACEGEARIYGLILEFDRRVDVDAVRVSASRTIPVRL